jgi:RNA recognition motif-containing protein
MTDEITKIFISGYPLQMDELQLVQLVSPYGEVHTIKIVRDKASGKPKGYSFIEMASRRAAEDVIIALDGSSMKDNLLTINIVEEAQAPTYKKVERATGPVKNKRPRITK